MTLCIKYNPVMWMLFLFIFVRTFFMLFFFPIFGSKNIPISIRIALPLVISLLVCIATDWKTESPINEYTLSILIPGIIKEALLGFSVGLTALLLFAGVQLAGQYMGFQMGFAIVNIIDPQGSSQISLLAALENFLAMVLFFATNAYHYFFIALCKSFETIPVGSFAFTGPVYQIIVESGARTFILAVKLAAPVIAILLFTNVVLAIVARTVPQINVFIVGFPLQIGVGMFILAISAQFLALVLGNSYSELAQAIYLMLRLPWT
jgi:flagellar biosynthetic protein FliR